MYCIAICDDEKQILNQIHTKVKACFEKEDVPAEYLCFDDARALMELLEKQYVDILFLDIDMPYFSGMVGSRGEPRAAFHKGGAGARIRRETDAADYRKI